MSSLFPSATWWFSFLTSCLLIYYKHFDYIVSRSSQIFGLSQEVPFVCLSSLAKVLPNCFPISQMKQSFGKSVIRFYDFLSLAMSVWTNSHPSPLWLPHLHELSTRAHLLLQHSDDFKKHLIIVEIDLLRAKFAHILLVIFFMDGKIQKHLW